MKLPDRLSYRTANSQLFIEYRIRTEPFAMEGNHFHSQYEIYYLLSGERYYFIRDRLYHIRPGDLVFIGKNELHRTSGTSDPGHERLVIYFFDSYIRQVSGDNQELGNLLLRPFVPEHPVLLFNVREQLEAGDLFNRLLREMKERAPGRELAIRHAVLDLLLLAARRTCTLEYERPQLLAPAQQKIADIVRYINAHYKENISLSVISERFYISPSHLSRVFKESTGFTLTEFLQTVRIREAQKLLTESDLKVSEVAAAVGFDNFSHFGKTFKKITRLSPRSYRSSN